jgi:uncharacterized protein (TIGR00266 family)
MFKHRIVSGPAFAEIVVTLQKGQRILADGGALSYLRSPVRPGELNVGGVAKGIARFVAGESLFQNLYDVDPASQQTEGEICFASPFPGDALYLPLKSATSDDDAEKWVLSRGAYVASSDNVKVSGKLNWRGILPGQEGMVLSKVWSEGGAGCVFIGAYGGFRAHELGAGQVLLIDNGMFLACPASAYESQYNVVKLGRSLTSSLFGGEGLGMEFTGPCTVYTQSRNFNDLVGQIAARLPESSSSGALGAVAGNVAAGFFDGGGRSDQRPPKPKPTAKPVPKPVPRRKPSAT